LPGELHVLGTHEMIELMRVLVGAGTPVIEDENG
jgi:hypothetical protein